jgi:type III restriction enzyme
LSIPAGPTIERKVRQPDITQPVLLEYVRRTRAFLVEKRALPLTALVRWKFVLAKVLAAKINLHREEASSARYQENLFGPQAAVETSFTLKFDFVPTGYSPHWTYLGHPYQFQKHYYAVGELKNKGEEYDCAKPSMSLTASNTGCEILIGEASGYP